MHDDLVQSCQKKFENKLPTRRAIYAKVKDQKDKVTASGQAQSTWGIQLSKDLRLEASADQRLGTGAFKVVRENNGYCVQCTLPITFTIFPKFSKIRGAMPLAGHHSIHQT
ncbi:hypothetical protein MTR_5g020395 [Medicago truncatula]|uniref:Uncharacterized protein n=1 Tax=Medicago truncatula TaxID=3880 RepID=A0A072UEN2_MEDTR|nr:hypothetical protein MTR_5g020395 [Medicago truncatula]